MPYIVLNFKAFCSCCCLMSEKWVVIPNFLFGFQEPSFSPHSHRLCKSTSVLGGTVLSLMKRRDFFHEEDAFRLLARLFNFFLTQLQLSNLQIQPPLFATRHCYRIVACS